MKKIIGNIAMILIIPIILLINEIVNSMISLGESANAESLIGIMSNSIKNIGNKTHIVVLVILIVIMLVVVIKYLKVQKNDEIENRKEKIIRNIVVIMLFILGIIPFASELNNNIIPPKQYYINELLHDPNEVFVISSEIEFIELYSGNDEVKALLDELFDSNFWKTYDLIVCSVYLDNKDGKINETQKEYTGLGNSYNICIYDFSKQKTEYFKTFFLPVKDFDSDEFDVFIRSVPKKMNECDLYQYLIVWTMCSILTLHYFIDRTTCKFENNNEKEISLKEINKKFIIKLIVCSIIYAIYYVGNIFFQVGHKPIIYLYPEETSEISVKLGLEDKITVSYPKYEDSWEVKAEPNGDLVDLETGRKLYALYYENENTYRYKIEDEGFVIKGKDSAKFLEEKLELLGLNYKEAEEFIVYWLPKLEANKYNYIRFASAEEIERNMPLEVSGNPDSVIRVMMTYKGLNRPIEVKEQEIITPERNGFVVVEWGGTEIR